MKKKVAILGAGITGLSLGWFLKKKLGPSIDLSILEAGDRAGGWIRTEGKKSFLIEKGPRSLRTHGNGRTTLQLIEDLGLQSEAIHADPCAKTRYLFYRGKLHKVPDNPLMLLRSPLTKGLFSSLLLNDILRFSKRKLDEESVYDFFSRKLNASLTERLIDPLISGIYAGDPKKLSMPACFPALVNMEKKYGSLLLGALLNRKQKETGSDFQSEMAKQPLFTFKQGLETLPLALGKKLSEEIVYNQKVEKIAKKKDSFLVSTAEGKAFTADFLFSCLPAPSIAKAVKDSFPEASDLLASIPFASVAVISLGFNEQVLPCPGYGYLIPSSEKESILGVVWDSSAFPQQNQGPQTRLTVMMGGSRMKDFHEHDKNNLLETAREALKRHIGLSAEPAVADVQIAKEAIAQYQIGHLQVVRQLELLLPFPILGASFRNVAVNDCIAEAKACARQFQLM